MKIQKKLLEINSMDLHPITLAKYEIDDNNRVRIFIPKFKNIIFVNLLKKFNRKNYYTVKLDKSGSMVWNNIDGMKTVEEICNKVKNEMNINDENFEQKTVKFLYMLYKQKAISFKEIE